MLSIFLQCLFIILLYATAWFFIALYNKRNDVADIAWGLGYIVICVFLAITKPYSPLVVLLFVLITCWGLRLSFHIYQRNKHKKEDFRYLHWRETWGKLFYVRSYFQVFIMQGVILLIIISPVIFASVQSPQEFTVFTWLGMGCWLIGFYFQAVGDYQLSVFTKNRRSTNEIMQTGLWKYTRHPNYFGEIIMWWGIYIMVLPLPNSVWFSISPLLISFLLIFVSGIPLLEKKYKGNIIFENYKKRTSSLIPMPPKKI